MSESSKRIRVSMKLKYFGAEGELSLERERKGTEKDANEVDLSRVEAATRSYALTLEKRGKVSPDDAFKEFVSVVQQVLGELDSVHQEQALRILQWWDKNMLRPGLL